MNHSTFSKSFACKNFGFNITLISLFNVFVCPAGSCASGNILSGGHCLNLNISHTSNLPELHSVLDRLKHCYRFFLDSPKRNGLLEEVVKKHIQQVTQRKALLDLCRTRWAERHSAHQHFYQAFVLVVEALEVIGHRMHLDRYGDNYSDWDGESRCEA